MKNPAKVVLKYESSRMIPHEAYTEKLTITINRISYEKKWLTNSPKYRKYAQEGERRPNIEWKASLPDGGYTQPLHQLNSYFFEDPANAYRDRGACDGDYMEYDITTPTKRKIQNGFSLCVCPEIMDYIHDCLVYFIDRFPTIPSFLSGDEY